MTFNLIETALNSLVLSFGFAATNRDSW